MNIRKFIAPTARQALKDIRSELGEEAVILSNRQVPEGVEIIALANDDINKLTGSVSAHKVAEKITGKPVEALEKTVVVRDEHLLREAPPIAAPVTTREPDEVIQRKEFLSNPDAASWHESIMGEIRSMRAMMQQQLAAMSFSDVQQRDPQLATLLRRMLNSGFSPLLARQMMDKMPAGTKQGESWIRQVLKCNLRVASDVDDIVVRGGVYALIGPTGVGKTTTTAKLAARAVVRYGADKVALLTTDSYRIGAYEQLKIYGKILGVAVHAVKDTDDLCLTLSALRHKHIVLIDTVGMGQRDGRVMDQNEMFDAAGVQRLLLLNATSGGDTLEDVVRMYNSDKVIGCIPTKLDEAVSLGALIDVVVRYRLKLHYIANGQRVPEDLYPVKLEYLLHRAFKAEKQKSAFTLNELELPVMMSGASSGEVINAL
ncbi:MAG: flagellar biosynthesis protein FlhF [Gallionella sp.]|nr:flagellar biosynthesis protein FlhF [Gallionella sp.]